MSSDMSFFHLVMGASPVVQLVMLLLLIISVMSWTMIFRKRSRLKKALSEANAFEEQFWSGGDLSTLYRTVSSNVDNLRGQVHIFVKGFKEFARLKPFTKLCHGP